MLYNDLIVLNIIELGYSYLWFFLGFNRQLQFDKRSDDRRCNLLDNRNDLWCNLFDTSSDNRWGNILYFGRQYRHIHCTDLFRFNRWLSDRKLKWAVIIYVDGHRPYVDLILSFAIPLGLLLQRQAFLHYLDRVSIPILRGWQSWVAWFVQICFLFLCSSHEGRSALLCLFKLREPNQKFNRGRTFKQEFHSWLPLENFQLETVIRFFSYLLNRLDLINILIDAALLCVSFLSQDVKFVWFETIANDCVVSLYFLNFSVFRFTGQIEIATDKLRGQLSQSGRGVSCLAGLGHVLFKGFCLEQCLGARVI